MSIDDLPDRTVVREVRLTDAELTVHLPRDHGDIHEAIAEALGARSIDDYTISETYEIEEY